jgi:hypothetical protein
MGRGSGSPYAVIRGVAAEVELHLGNTSPRGSVPTSAASFSRMPPSRLPASQRNRALASGPHDVGISMSNIHGDPTGAALALKMRPTASPSASTSKSSSFHSRRMGERPRRA